MADNALMRHRRMQETQRAFADQFNRSTPQDYPVVERASLLPVATYANGQTGLAWPGMIADDIPNALTAPARALRGEMPNYLDDRDAYLSEGLNFAGTAAVGGSVVPKPTSTAGVFGGNLPSGIKAKRSTNANGQTNYTLTDETAGAPVGSAYVRDLGDNAQVGRVSIADDYQRQGIGTALYGQIESDLGKKLVPDETLSPKAYSFWMKHHPERVGDYTPPSSPDGFYVKSREAGTGTGSGDPVALQALLDSIDDGKRTTLAANSRPSSLPGTILSEAGKQPKTVRAYHGTSEDFTAFDPSKMGSRGKTDEGAFFFGSPEIANAYAEPDYTIDKALMREIIQRNTTPEGKMRMDAINKEFSENSMMVGSPRVIPADIDTSNFGRANLFGYRWERDEGARLRSQIDRAKAEGKDGLVINGMTDATGISDPQYAVWGRGTVRSPLSGDILYANGRPSTLPGTLLSEAADQAPRVSNPLDDILSMYGLTAASNALMRR